MSGVDCVAVGVSCGVVVVGVSHGTGCVGGAGCLVGVVPVGGSEWVWAIRVALVVVEDGG